ncbi:MAG: SAM-dependent methyltransferase [Ferrovum myxofaciens]|nr:MAG: SAM-dependent methyltransferase [Ferrovum myxofaciens]
MPETVARTFYIVGIGASAGGLEAFEQFFRHTHTDSGMAFVLVSHLNPGHASILTEILQRTTSMSVVEAQDQMAVMPNCVYVIPPNRDMAIFHGALQLSVPNQPRGQRMPIDAFLRSLAEDQNEKAIGIILSGTGTDGTLGLRAILGVGGATLVQEPASAKYDGMPNSAIQAGYATLVLPVEKMPNALLTGICAPKYLSEVASAASKMNHILMQLRRVTGHDFSQYKKSTLGRRIDLRMSLLEMKDREDYAHYLKEHPAEIIMLFKELLINVTKFFRDQEAFDALKQEILPQLMQSKPDDTVFRAWVAGCSTGEEAYSIAILLREFMDEANREFKILLYATDLDDDAIATARAGIYPPNIVQDVSPERLRRFFIKDDAGYHVRKDIRETIVFAIHNVIKDPPFAKLDLLSCRNLLIYLEPEVQNRLIQVFHYALKPNGVLFLSPTESIGRHPGLFMALNRKWKFYSAVDTSSSSRVLMSAGLVWAGNHHAKEPDETIGKTREPDFAELTKRVLLQSYAPASVLTDDKGTILYVHGDTGKYLRPAPGQATLNIVEMAREGLQSELRLALNKVKQDTPTSTTTPNQMVRVKINNGDLQIVHFSVRSLPTHESQRKFLLISFQDGVHPAPAKACRSKGSIAGHEELTYTKENLQAAIEEQQVSNEELQSTNEELQSTNEELETSKEELQSVNEELVTVNTELQAKIEQLSDIQNDMKNLLDNINVGTVFLDNHLHIKRYTREAVHLYRLVASDVGRPLSDIKSNIEGEDMLSNAQSVLDTLVPFELKVRTTGGAYYLARIQPYRTLDSMINGVVLTFSDISQLVRTQMAENEARELTIGIFDTIHELLIVLNDELQVVTASRSFYHYFQATEEGTIGRPIYELGQRQWDIPELRGMLENILPKNLAFEGYRVEQDFLGIGHRKLVLNARCLVGKSLNKPMILLAIDELA